MPAGSHTGLGPACRGERFRSSGLCRGSRIRSSGRVCGWGRECVGVRGRAGGAAATRTAPDADGSALDGEAASSTTVGGGGWGTEDDGECVADGGGAFSKVVAARRSTLRTKGQLDPLYLLEAVQVWGWDPDPASNKVNPLNLLV